MSPDLPGARGGSSEYRKEKLIDAVLQMQAALTLYHDECAKSCGEHVRQPTIVCLNSLSLDVPCNCALSKDGAWPMLIDLSHGADFMRRFDPEYATTKCDGSNEFMDDISGLPGIFCT